MALTPWEPFEDLLSWQEVFNRMLADRPAGHRKIEPLPQFMPVDVRETETDYAIDAALPGVQPDAIHVTAVEHLLTIRAVREQEESREKVGKYVRREHYRGELTRTLTLPYLIDPAKVEATFEHGMLTVRIPKSTAAAAKRIPVKAKETSRERIKDATKEH